MPALPSGTVTFLFTDIEGSSLQWEQQPIAMRAGLARHDELMRNAIAEHDGRVFKTAGDAFCAAFHTASDALAAALSAQLAIVEEPWPEPLRIKVRMALHTGTAEVRENDYFGQALNRVARLLSAAHGGQVLLSTATQELSRDALLPEVSFQDMGEHRLKDLNRPERIYQLRHPGLPFVFPPLKTLDHLPNNLPWQLTSFIGREKEIAEVIDLLPKTRLLTLTGSGGCGKTRLGLQVAADLLDQYVDGVWFVELAALTDPELLAQTVARTLGLVEQDRHSFLDLIINQLRAKRLLLVLDNCEHLLSACAEFAGALLRNCAQVRILASSREALGIAGELTYRVPSLGLPDRNQKFTVDNITHYEAVQLFVERALFHRSDFTLTIANVPALASICYRLDGIPLAIELAAARTRSLSAEEINTRLDDRFRLLTGGSKTALPRQQTLRALIDWSYGLLTSQEKSLFCCLSVFSGGWTLEAATKVLPGGIYEDWEVLDLMTGLVEKSLAIAETGERATRYRFLETVRQFARERMADAPESSGIRERHRDHFLALAEEVSAKLAGPDQAKWLRVLDADHDNLRQALTFSLEEPEGREQGLRFCMALSGFWQIRGHLSEGRERWSVLLANRETSLPREMLPAALNFSAELAAIQRDDTAARSQFEESLALARMLGDDAGVARALKGLGSVAISIDEFVSARTYFEESVKIYERIGDRRGLAGALLDLGFVMPHFQPYVSTYYEQALAIYRELGDVRGVARATARLGISEPGRRTANRRLEESLSLYKEIEDRDGTAKNLLNLAIVASQLGDYSSARASAEESLAISTEIGVLQGVGYALMIAGEAAFRQQDHLSARAYFDRSLAVFLEVGNRWEMGLLLNSLGLMEMHQGNFDSARSYAQQSLALSKEVRNRWCTGLALDTLGRLALESGDNLAARTYFNDGLAIRMELGDPMAIWPSLTSIAFLAAAEKQWSRSTILFAAADCMLEVLEIVLPFFISELKDRDAAIARESLGEEAYLAAQAKGRAMTREQATAYALATDLT